MKKLLLTLIIILFSNTNTIANICNPNYPVQKPGSPPDSELLLEFYPLVKPAKPLCLWNSTPCTEIELNTYNSQVIAYNMMLNEFEVYYDQYIKDLNFYAQKVRDYIKCDFEYVNRQIEFRENLP